MVLLSRTYIAGKIKQHNVTPKFTLTSSCAAAYMIPASAKVRVVMVAFALPGEWVAPPPHMILWDVMCRLIGSPFYSKSYGTRYPFVAMIIGHGIMIYKKNHITNHLENHMDRVSYGKKIF